MAVVVVSPIAEFCGDKSPGQTPEGPAKRCQGIPIVPGHDGARSRREPGTCVRCDIRCLCRPLLGPPHSFGEPLSAPPEAKKCHRGEYGPNGDLGNGTAG